MKFNKLIIGGLLSTGLIFSSCDKVIDVEPEFVLDGRQVFTSLSDYGYSLTGTYAQFRQVGYYGTGGQTTGSWSILPDMMSDNLVRTGEDLANWAIQVNFQYTADEDDIRVAWLAAYSVVSQANLTLKGIDAFAAENPDLVNRIKGEALAIRGMAHFDVLRYWGESFDRNSTARGIPYKTVVDTEAMPARLNVKESYDNIFRDLEEAEILLAGGGRQTATRAYIDLVTVKAMLSRVHLYAKNYAQAEAYASEVIEARPLATKTQFPSIWRDAPTSEVIWSIAINPGEVSPSFGIHIASSNRNRFRPEAALEATYNKENDIRYNTYFASRDRGATAVIFPGNTGPRFGTATDRRILNKFNTRTGILDNVVNWKVFRTGEMYLIRAEARAMQPGKELLGLEDLNTLRNARIGATYVPAVLVGNALLDAIALERRKELIGEGHRWFDLKRTTRTVNRTESASTTRMELAPDSHAWAWPIPQPEMDANTNPEMVQTEGY
jgi:starch-binding outer membrane protein, SusD/RagB family